MRKVIFVAVYMLISLTVHSQCRYEFIGTQISQSGNVGFNVGELHSNGNYSGICGTMPLFGSKTFSMNVELGKGLVKTTSPWSKTHVGILGYGIAGLFATGPSYPWRFNYGLGGQIFYKSCFAGLEYTNHERLLVKFGFYFSSLDI